MEYQFSNDLANFLNNNATGSQQAKASLNWLLFDEQLNFVTGNANMVQSGLDTKQITQLMMKAFLNGYNGVYNGNTNEITLKKGVNLYAKTISSYNAINNFLL